MVRHARFSRASRRRENVHPPTRVRRERTTSLFPLGFENAIRARVTSSGLPSPTIPPATPLTDRDHIPPRTGTPQAGQIGAPRGRAGTPWRTSRRTRARACRISRAAFRKTNARHFLRSFSLSRSKRASHRSLTRAPARRTRRARSRASPNPNVRDPPNPSPARVRRSESEIERARADARDDARSSSDGRDRDAHVPATTRPPPRRGFRSRLELTGLLFFHSRFDRRRCHDTFRETRASLRDPVMRVGGIAPYGGRSKVRASSSASAAAFRSKARARRWRCFYFSRSRRVTRRATRRAIDRRVHRSFRGCPW